jgi:beta-lactamase class A
VVGALLAYVLIGAFLGVLGWKLADTHAETRRLEAFERPNVAAEPPPPPAAVFEDEPLGDVLKRQMPATGTVGLYVKNLTTGAEADLDGRRVFPAASLYKLPVLAEVVRQVRLRRLSLDQSMVVSRSHWVAGSGVLQARVGQSLTVRELLTLLVVESDNIAAMMLIDLAGLENVNQTAQAIGLRSTRLLDHRAASGNNGLGPYVTSPADMGLLLETIASGKLVDAVGSEEALQLLERKQSSGWLGDGLPWWAKIAHKWGEVPGARHDAGIVFTPRSHYVIVVMTSGLDANGSAAYIREVSKAVFSHFERSG